LRKKAFHPFGGRLCLAYYYGLKVGRLEKACLCPAEPFRPENDSKKSPRKNGLSNIYAGLIVSYVGAVRPSSHQTIPTVEPAKAWRQNGQHFSVYRQHRQTL
jgi:hypothetical protein